MQYYEVAKFKRIRNMGLRVTIGLLLLLSIGLWAGTFAAQADTPSIKVALNNEEVSFQEAPFLQNGTTFVQIRPLFEALGIEMKWDKAQRVVHGTKEGLSFSLPVAGKEATVNGKLVAMDVSAIIRNDHTLVPLRFISESADVLVLWDGYNRLIYMYGDDYLEQEQETRESVTKKFESYLEDEKQKRQQGSPQPEQGTKPEPDGDLKTPSSLKELSHLEGMYYGYRLDVGGYQCGGVCWPKYTFLDNNKLLIGEPENGGPEKIDCSTDDCLSYSLKEGKLVLSNGKSYSIRLTGTGEPIINDIRLTKVEPVQKGLKLDGTYTNYGYGSSATYRESIDFKPDGTYTRYKITGTYSIEDNTIKFVHADGEVHEELFFLHHGEIDAIQIHDKNYNLDN